jgi:hypothetical protein
MKKHLFFALFILLLTGSGFAVEEVIPTSLKITIRNDLGNLETDVTVTLYASQEDFQKEQNALQQETTNAKGMVTFKDLQAKVYYVAAVKGDMNNYGAGVQTNQLEAKKVNKVTIIIE